MSDLVLVHGGGPTAVINASLAGSVRELKEQGFKGRLLAARYGVRGIFNSDYADLTNLDGQDLARLEHTPGSAIGTGRDHLEDEDYEKLAAELKAQGIGYVIMTGGNGTMDTCRRLAAVSARHGITVTGTPKTMDNDLSVTDHSPGYGSYARYLAASVKEAVADVEGLPIHAVVIEAFGRDAGWGTASSALSRLHASSGPDIILPPELPFSEEAFLERVLEIHKEKGGLVIVASEGLRYEDGTPIVEPVFKTDRSVYFGDVSSHLASLIVRRLGIKSRSEKPGILGRASIAWQSEVDVREAVECGRLSARAALDGKSAFMSIIKRIPGKEYRSEVILSPILDEILEARTMPEEFFDKDRLDVTEAFYGYAGPLTGDLGPDFISFTRRNQ